MTNINEEMQSVSVTLSVPVKDIAGLVAINYKELASKVYDEFDMRVLACDLAEEIDTDDLIEKIDMDDLLEKIDMDDLVNKIDIDDLARSFKNQIDISDYIDTDQIASEAADQIDVENKIHTLLNDYNPSNSCGVGNAATKAMINAIRFDIMNHLYGRDKSNVDVTMTDVLGKFIRQELARIEEEKTTFTIGEIIDVLTGINSVNHKITEIVVAFSKAKPQAMKTLGEVIIKAD